MHVICNVIICIVPIMPCHCVCSVPVGDTCSMNVCVYSHEVISINVLYSAKFLRSNYPLILPMLCVRPITIPTNQIGADLS